MLMSKEQTDHFMVGEAVEFDGQRGTVQAVIEHEYEVGDRERETHKRVLVDLGDREVNASSSDVEVVR